MALQGPGGPCPGARATTRNPTGTRMDLGRRPAAEGVGFEPTVPRGHNGFRDRPIRPLSHPSSEQETIGPARRDVHWSRPGHGWSAPRRRSGGELVVGPGGDAGIATGRREQRWCPFSQPLETPLRSGQALAQCAQRPPMAKWPGSTTNPELARAPSARLATSSGGISTVAAHTSQTKWPCAPTAGW